MKKVVAILAVAALVAGGALAAIAQDDESDPNAVDQPKPMPVVSEVLNDLVNDGTINQDQADAILTALHEKRLEIRENIREHRELMRSLWEDGVLTSDEIDQLPPEHPFRNPDGPVAEYLEDGELTREELRELRPFPPHKRLRSALRTFADTD